MHTTVEQRDYQVRVINNTIKAIKEGHRTIMIESPTGSGKTIMAYRILEELKKAEIPRLGCEWDAGWTCMRRNLIRQAAQENQAKFGLDYVNYFSTFAKTFPKVQVLIEDEAQHSASETSTKLYSRIEPEVHIAMTATPYRTDRMKLCFSKVIRDAGIRHLIDAGYLSPFHHYIAPVDWTPSNVASIYLAQPEHWGKSVVFFLTLKACYQFARLLERAGISTEVVHGGSNQEKQIARFNAGEIDVLVNVFVLTEGFDAPELRTVFVRPGSKGPTVQMAGRSLRKHPGKPFAQIVQNEETKWAFTKVASCARKFKLEHGVWVEQTSKTGVMTQAQKSCLRLMASIPSKPLPRFIRDKKNAGWRRHGADDQAHNPGDVRAVDGVDYSGSETPRGAIMRQQQMGGSASRRVRRTMRRANVAEIADSATQRIEIPVADPTRDTSEVHRRLIEQQQEQPYTGTMTHADTPVFFNAQ